MNRHGYPDFPEHSDETDMNTENSVEFGNQFDETDALGTDDDDETPETVQHSHYMEMQDEREMAEKIGNREIETGIPQNLSQGKSKGTKMLIFIGIGLLGFGVCIAGLMLFVGRSNKEEIVKNTENKEMITNGKKRDFSKEPLDLGASTPEETPQPDEEDPDVGEASAVAETGEVAASEPQQTPYDRKQSGSVLVENVSNGSQMQESSNGQNDTDGSISGLSPSEMQGLQPSAEGNGGGFGNRLNPTQTASAQAMQRGDLTYLLPKGTNIACTLETKIVTTQPGFTRCLVTNDVYSANGKVLLLERGSKVVGEQTAAMLQGQARVFVLWNEAETPTGIKINLASPAAGQLGEAGTDARVKYHFWRRFGGAVMISMIGDLGNYAANRKNSNANGQTFNFDGTSRSAQDMATEALKNSINIPPTGYVNQGSIINIMVARDVDFSGVYRRIDSRQIPTVPAREGMRIRQ